VCSAISFSDISLRNNISMTRSDISFSCSDISLTENSISFSCGDISLNKNDILPSFIDIKQAEHCQCSGKYRNCYNNGFAIFRVVYRFKQNIIQISPKHREYRDINRLSFALLLHSTVEVSSLIGRNCPFRRTPS